jgi:hypothetical protein
MTVDPTRQAAGCTACHTRFATELAITAPPYRPSEARWILVPLLGAFAAALGLLAVSQLAGFLVWVASCAVTLAVGAWHTWSFGRTTRRSTASLPSAMALPRREQPHRPLPPPG